jgi:hypothetical protein
MNENLKYTFGNLVLEQNLTGASLCQVQQTKSQNHTPICSGDSINNLLTKFEESTGTVNLTPQEEKIIAKLKLLKASKDMDKDLRLLETECKIST